MTTDVISTARTAKPIPSYSEYTSSSSVKSVLTTTNENRVSAWLTRCGILKS
jgi:hypothetical protein